MRIRVSGSIPAGLLLIATMLIPLSGCNSGSAIITATSPPVQITVLPPTLPPTWTPGPSPTLQAATNTPVVTFQAALGADALSALPATWTPAPLRTDTPIPIVTATDDTYGLTLTAFVPQSGATINPTTPAPPTQEGTAQPPLSPLRANFPAACANFVVNPKLTSRMLMLGSNATIVWKPIREANAYHIWLATTDGFYRYNATVSDDRVIIPAKEFLVAGQYGWELVAYTDFNPICAHQTGVIVVSKG